MTLQFRIVSFGSEVDDEARRLLGRISLYQERLVASLPQLAEMELDWFTPTRENLDEISRLESRIRAYLNDEHDEELDFIQVLRDTLEILRKVDPYFFDEPSAIESRYLITDVTSSEPLEYFGNGSLTITAGNTSVISLARLDWSNSGSAVTVNSMAVALSNFFDAAAGLVKFFYCPVRVESLRQFRSGSTSINLLAFLHAKTANGVCA